MINQDTTMILSSGEIYVLAGLLGYSSVFAVEENTLREWQPVLKKQVQEVMRRLEKRMLVLCEPSGTVYLDEMTARMLRCMCEPESVGLITGSTESGRRTDTYVLRRGGDAAVCRKMAPDAYKLSMTNNPGKLLGLNDTVAPIELHVQMPFDDAQRISEALHAFNQDIAEETIREYTSSDDAVQAVMQVLSKCCRILRIQCKRRNKGYYSSSWDCLLVKHNEQLIRVQIDRADQLCFDGIGATDILASFTAAIDPEGILEGKGMLQ